MDFIVAIIVFLLIIGILQFGKKINISILKEKKIFDSPVGSKIMAAFLSGFIFFVLLTDKMPQQGQKIPIVIISILLIYANLFIHLGHSEVNQKEIKE